MKETSTTFNYNFNQHGAVSSSITVGNNYTEHYEYFRYLSL